MPKISATKSLVADQIPSVILSGSHVDHSFFTLWSNDILHEGITRIVRCHRKKSQPDRFMTAPLVSKTRTVLHFRLENSSFSNMLEQISTAYHLNINLIPWHVSCLFAL